MIRLPDEFFINIDPRFIKAAQSSYTKKTEPKKTKKKHPQMILGVFVWSQKIEDEEFIFANEKKR